MQDLKHQHYLFRITHWLILYPNAFLFSLNQILSLKGYWAHTDRVIHVPCVEVAIRIHTEHDSIRSIIRRLENLKVFRLTINILTQIIIHYNFFSLWIFIIILSIK